MSMSYMNPANPMSPASPINQYYYNQDYEGYDDGKTVIKDEVEHHKGYDTHTIQREPVHDPNAKYGNWFMGIGFTVIIIFGIVATIGMFT